MADASASTQLLQHAVSYAEFAMGTMGHVPPAFLAQTPQGLVGYFPSELEDNRSKAYFANVARLIATGYTASAGAMILESGVIIAKPGRVLDPSLIPSRAPDREERVVIMLETGRERISTFFTIELDGAGKFIRFGREELPGLPHVRERFLEIIPPAPQNKGDRKLARDLLRIMEIIPEKLGVNPGWS